ncbi:MAG: hypothetical protein DRP78_07335, partial [Candidatus Omnitrophota bacterium]
MESKEKLISINNCKANLSGMIILIFVLTLLASGVLGFGGSVRAQVISGVSQGNINNGDSITISGSGFGSKSTAAPVISSYDHPVSANNMEDGIINGEWTTRASTTVGSLPQYKRTPFYQNDYYVDCPFVSGDYSQFRYDGAASLGRYFYISFWYYVTADAFVVSSQSYNSKIWGWYTHNLCSVQAL